MANRLRNMKIGEVSFCRKGMNQHAKVALFKSADDVPQGPQAIAKATFAEALEGSMIAGAVNEAFYSSFDGLWQRNDAFRTALTDELAEGGDGSVASEAYKASVNDLVDTAVAEARKAGVTATDTSDIEKVLTAAVDGWLMAKKETTMLKIKDKAELQTAIEKFDPAKTTLADVQIIQKAAKDLGAEDTLPVALAPTAPSPELAKAQREISILKMDEPTSTYFNGLDEAGQDAFLGKSADDQKAEVDKANETDPVVHKCADGTLIRKSDGPTLLALAKGRDADAAEIAKLRGEVAGSTVEKTAVEKYPNVAKAVAVQTLKAVEGVGADSDAGKAMLATLDGMNKGGGRLFKTLGSTEDDGRGSGDETVARTEFDAEVGKVVAEQKIGRAEAMTKVRQSKPDLFAKAFPETVEAAEASAEEARSHTN